MNEVVAAFVGPVETFPTLVSIGHFSPSPIISPEALAVVSVLVSVLGHLDRLLGGLYAASRLRRLVELYPNYRNEYKTVVVVVLYGFVLASTVIK